MMIFSFINMHFLTLNNDHDPLMIEMICRNKEVCYNKRALSRFHYEDMWSSSDECKDIVKHEWPRKRENG